LGAPVAPKSEAGGNGRERKPAAPGEVVQKLVQYGHDKKEILSSYTRDEIALFYEKIIAGELRRRADDIEAVMAGIGGAFGGGKNIAELLKKLREGG
jgi:hypothetical protein